MISPRNILFVVVWLVVPAAVFSAVKKDKYFINPTVQNFDSFPSFAGSTRWYVSTVEDSITGQDTTGIIGYTRTGIRSKAPLICSPLLAVALRNSVFNMFNSKNAVSLDISSAKYLIRLKILSFSLDEKSSFLSQTLNAKLKLETIIVDPLDAGRVRRFVVDSENSVTALDTSNYAESIIRDIFSAALLEIWKTINK